MSSIEQAIARLGSIPSPEKVSPPDGATFLKTVNRRFDGDHKKALDRPPTKAPLEVDWKALERAGYLTPNTLQGAFAEEYRLIKRTLLINAKQEFDEWNPTECRNLVAITSALVGDGKSFTTFNLALSIATGRDNTVLVVDADLEGRSLTKLLGLTEAPGLTDFLLDPMLELRDVITNTIVPGLRIIPAGFQHPDGTELLASELMQGLVYELSTRYRDRIVLFDTPPLLGFSTQSLVLNSLAGQILVVVEEGRTSQKAVKEAVEMLDENKAVGMILNKCSRWFDSQYRSPRNGLSK